MALTPTTASTASTSNTGQTYRRPFAIMTVLFFMWGFITVFNDILIPRFKEAFTLDYYHAMFVQLAFFGAYFIGSLIYFIISATTGDPIAKIGYKNGVIIGLLISAAGSALFWPAATLISYPLFLVGLFVVGLGFAMLQIAANPYVTILGPERTASSRLNLAQAFNSVGTGGIEDDSFTAVNARYVRMYGMQRGTAGGYSLNEFSVYEPLNAPANSQFQPLVYISNVNAAFSQSNSSINLSWTSTIQQIYGIQFTTNLANPAWLDYEPQVAATGHVANIFISTTNWPQQFFRGKPAF